MPISRYRVRTRPSGARSFLRVLICGGITGVVAVPLVAYAQDAPVETAPVDPAAEARQQYAAGTQAYGAKKFVEAALHFEAAATQRAHAVTLYTAALAWEQANRPERACDDYGRALEVPGLSPQQATNARERVATLEKSLGTVAIMAPEGWRVQLLGLSEAPAPARLHATAGTHTLSVRAPNRPIEKRDVTLESGQTTRIELDGSEPVAAVADNTGPQAHGLASVFGPQRTQTRRQAAPVAASSLRRSLGFGAIGVGVATLGAGVVLGFQAVDARDTYDLAPSRATLDHAQGLQTWTTIAFIAGAAFTVGGVVLVILPDSAKSETTAARLTIAPGIGGGALRGTF